MPKRGRSRSLARKGTSAAAAERRRCQEDDQQRDSRLALARLAHSLASNIQPASTIVRRKKGDYTSVALEYDPQSFQTEACLGCDTFALAAAVLMDKFDCNSFLFPLNISGSCMMDTILTPSSFCTIFENTTASSR